MNGRRIGKTSNKTKYAIVFSSILMVMSMGESSAAGNSSLTLFGVADTGIGKIAAAGEKTKMLAGGAMNNAQSRIGFRGVETLANGGMVGFTIESGLGLNDGGNRTTGAGFWGRNAFVWTSGSWGRLKMGRTLNVSFFSLYQWDLTGANPYSVVGQTFGYLGDGPRTSSQISYRTPTFNGFNAEIGHVLKDDHGGKSKWDLNILYSGDALRVGFGANKTKGNKTNFSLGAKYNIGKFILASSYSKVYLMGGGNPDRMERSGMSAGVTYRFDQYRFTLNSTRDFKNKVHNKKYTNYLAEAKYALSRRTELYAAYLRFNKTSNWGIGITHRF